MNKIWKSLIIILVFNLCYSLINTIMVKPKRPEIRFLRFDKSDTVNLIIPGMCHPPMSTFEPFIDEMKGDVAIVDFDGIRWNTAVFQKSIKSFIDNSGYKEYRVFAISIGDKLIRGSSGTEKIPIPLPEPSVADNVKIYAINPCGSAEIVQSRLSKPLRVTLPVIGLAISSLGPLSDLRIIPIDSVRHSLTELFTQGWATIYEYSAYRIGAESQVILSEDDEFINNNVVKEEIDDSVKYVYVPGPHSQLVGYKDDYVAALKEFGAFD